jgi:hypothetical protein
MLLHVKSVAFTSQHGASSGYGWNRRYLQLCSRKFVVLRIVSLEGTSNTVIISVLPNLTKGLQKAINKVFIYRNCNVSGRARYVANTGKMENTYKS